MHDGNILNCSYHCDTESWKGLLFDILDKSHYFYVIYTFLLNCVVSLPCWP